MFDSSISGALMTGLNMIKFSCEHLSKLLFYNKRRPASITMLYPNVIPMGPDAACISFVRITQFEGFWRELF